MTLQSSDLTNIQEPYYAMAIAHSRARGYTGQRQPRIGAMQSFVAFAVVGAVLLLTGTAACTFKERAGQVLVANEGLTIPVQGKDAKMECATTASAFGMLAASISTFFLLQC